MAISLTLFKSQFDNKTHRRLNLDNFEVFQLLLEDLSKQPKKGKKDAELISPAVYNDGTTRSNKNVLCWAGWCAVDVDDIDVDGDIKNYVQNIVDGWKYVCYSTASSRKDKPKFRLVFELDQDIKTDDIRHFWFALQTELGDLGDKQCKDLSRMYYIPAQYQDAYNFFFTGDGTPIDVQALLDKHPYVEKSKMSGNFLDRLPPELADQVVKHRKSMMESRKNDIHWTSYHDCPFWPKRLATEYQSITSTGWYHKMYQIMVAVAAKAISKEYPITAQEIAYMCKQFDMETGGWYENRPLDLEADRALEYAYRNV